MGGSSNESSEPHSEPTLYSHIGSMTSVYPVCSAISKDLILIACRTTILFCWREADIPVCKVPRLHSLIFPSKFKCATYRSILFQATKILAVRSSNSRRMLECSTEMVNRHFAWMNYVLFHTGPQLTGSHSSPYRLFPPATIRRAIMEPA
jgi:hypothetical protein